MTSSAAEPKASTALTSAETAASAGGASTAPGVQDGFQTTPEGRSIEAVGSANSHRGTDAGIDKLMHDVPAGHIHEADQEDHKKAIISILEDWAEWERTLEVDTNDKDVVARVQELPVAVATTTKPAESPLIGSNDGKRSASHHARPKARVVAELNRSATRKPYLGERKTLSATYPTGGSTQLLYTSRRERRRAEKHDPVARARRQALKVWAADQTRRRSSAEQSSMSESLQQRERGPSMREMAIANASGRRRSSADVTVDHNRKSGGRSLENELFRRTKPPSRVFAPREISSRRDSRSADEMRPEQRRPPRTEAPDAVLRLKGALAKPRLKRRNSHPWRENMKALEKRGGWSTSYLAPQGDPPALALIPRVSTTVASSPSTATGRGSPWARSPSRETAGGILVKHCFFYGSAGRATTRGGVTAAASSPTFESPWMRQFREEVQSNPNWWLGSDQFVLGRATPSYAGDTFGRNKGVGGTTPRPAFPTATVARREKSGNTDRATDLWKEVRALLAAGKHGSAKRLGDERPGSEGADEERAVITDKNDYLSFGDRLRCTPLSQGAWLVGNGAIAAAAAADSVQLKPQSVESLPANDGITVAAADTLTKRATGVNSEVGIVGEGKQGSTDGALDNSPASPQIAQQDEGKGETGSNGRRKVTRRSSWRELQSIHATTLAKLRGEIDPVTREELVLRAAEEARGALDRDRARSTSPRRSSAGVFRPSSKGRKKGCVPDSIDYDKVEATLSLIELATRAAGPDAGKQMLHALEGLEKIHQRVSDENQASKDAGERVGSKRDLVILDGDAVDGAGDVHAAKGSGDGSRQDLNDGAGSNEDTDNAEQRVVPIDEIPGAERTAKEVGAGGVAPATTDAEASTKKDRQPDSGRAPAVEKGSTIVGKDDPLCEAKTEGEVSAANPPSVPRKLSLALSSSSEESSKSEASSVGVMQTIGNWLWASPSPEPSRRNSQSSDADGEQEVGRSEFPLPPEGATSISNDDVEAIVSGGEAISTAEKQLSSGRSASERQSSVMLDEPIRIMSSETEASTVAEPLSGKQDGRDETPSEQHESINSMKPSGQVESSPSISQGAARSTMFGRLDSADQDPHDSPSTKLAKVSSKARRSSEADKPTGLPYLAAEIARVEESVPSTGNHQHDTAREQLNEEGAQRFSDGVGNPPTSASNFSVEFLGSEESKFSVDSRRPESDAEMAPGATEAPTAGHLGKAIDDNNLGIEMGERSEEMSITGLPNHAAVSEIGTEPLHRKSPLVSTTTGNGGYPALTYAITERSVHTEDSRQAAILTDGGGALAEAGNAMGHDTLALPHRDSWVSVGTRPRRGKNAVMVESPPRAAGKDDSRAAPTSGRPERSSLETTGLVADYGNGANVAKEEATTARWESRKVSVKFVWPKAGSIGNPKRLRPPGEMKKISTPLVSEAPGIVRRSPLIDALHPEVSRQREFQRKLRETRQQRDAAAGSSGSPSSVVAAPESSRKGIGPKTAKAAGRRKPKAVDTAAAPGVARTSNAGQDSVAKEKVKEKAKHYGGTDGAAATTTAATTKAEVKTRSRRRSLWSEPVPLPVPPLSVAALPPPPSPTRQPRRPGQVPSDSEALGSEGLTSVRTAFSDAGSLTVLQWRGVDDWLAGARLCLGDKVWACLGSSAAFSRALARLQVSLVPGDRAGQNTGARRAAASSVANPAGLNPSLPQKGMEVTPRDGLVKSVEAVHGRGGVRRGQRGEGKKVGTAHARKGRGHDGSGSNNQTTAEEVKFDEHEASVDGSNGGLSEKTALAVDAVIWTIATEGERTATCEYVCSQSPRNGSDRPPVGPLENSFDRQAKLLSSPASEVMASELKVSLPVARRFIKGSRLVDGVYVLDADVDLAFKRWEEVESLAVPASPDAFPVANPAVGYKGASRRDVKGKGVGCGFADGATRATPKHMLCEAVGCSDPARYGDIQPMARAKLCRKHRRNGMVDVGSRRCDRPGCGRLAVGGSSNSRTGEATLCTLHAREGRVGVEGLAFVLLTLSNERHTRTRRILSTTTVAAIQVEEQALLTHNCAEQGPATESESTALHVSAVRNVLLAVTKQPLVPGIPAAGRQQVRRSRMVEGGRHFDSPTNDICLGDSFASSIGSIRTRMSDRSTSEATTSATATATAAASSSRKTPGSQRQDDRCCARGSSYQNFDETAGEGFGNSQQPDLLRLSPEGRASRRYSEAGGAVAAASRVPAVSDGQGHGERDGERDGEEEERSSAHAYREERHWQSSPPQHYEIERKEEYLLYLEEERGGSMPEKHTTGGCEEGAEEQLQQGGETLLVSPVRGSQSTTGGVRTTAHITTDPFGDDCGDQQRHTGVPQQSRSRRTGVGGRGGKGGLVQSMASSAGTGGEPRDTARRSGVDEVLGENATSLRAVFRKFSRQSSSARKKEAAMTMSLFDILRFCDAFELRPGLVSTREILDAFKEVAYPGVVGLTDEEVGYSATTAGIPGRPDAQAARRPCKRGRSSNVPQISPVSPHGVPLRPDSSPSKNTHAGTDVFPLGEERADNRDDRGKDSREPSAFDETAELDATFVGDHVSLKEPARQDLTLRDLAIASSELARRGKAHEHRGSESTTAGELSRIGSDSTRGTFQREGSSSSSFRRVAGSRRGTAQQEDDECSLYFKSDSGVDGQHRMPFPSRRASSASSSSRGGGGSGRGKRTVYLGRTQVFPLRRVESSLAVDARGFGLSGACPDIAIGAGGSRRRRTSTLGSSPMQRRSPSRRPSVTHDPLERGTLDAPAGDAACDPVEEGPSTAAPPGITEAQFFQWLTEVAAECKVLTTKKTLGCSVTKPHPRTGSSGRKRRGSESGSFIRGDVRSEKGNLKIADRRQDAARAIVLLQWMEVSRGMKEGKQGGIPPFRISTSLAKRTPHTS